MGDGLGSEEQLAQKFGVASLRLPDAGDNLFGHDQNVNGCLGIYVVKGDQVGVFVHDVRRDFSADDLFEGGHRASGVSPTS